MKRKMLLIIISLAVLILLTGSIWFFNNYVCIRSDVKYSVNEQLGKKLFYKKSDLQGIRYVRVMQFDEDEWREIKYFPNLESLEAAYFFESKSREPLPQFDKMENLRVVYSDQEDLEFLANFSSAKKVEIGDDGNYTDFTMKSLKGIERFKNIEELVVYGIGVVEVKHITNSQSLEYLSLWYATPNDYETIGNMTNLKRMRLICSLDDYSFICFMTGLEKLEVGNAGLTNIPDFDKLDQLKELVLSNNKIEVISTMGHPKKLETVLLDNNNISDISFLSEMTNLKTLILTDNNITNIDSLFNLEKLVKVNLKNNPIEDQEKLEELYRIVEERAKKEAEAKE